MSSKVISPEVISWISQHRTAPIGKLWALNRHLPSNLPVGTKEYSGLVVSRQLARELGWPKPETYPDWPGYPISPQSGPHTCAICAKDHLTADYPWHDEASREADLKRIAALNPKLSMAQVRAAFPGSRQPVSQSLPSQSRVSQSPQSVGQVVARCEVCNKPLRPRAHTGGSAQRFCSNACQQVSKRASRT